MTKAIRVHATGGPEVLSYEDVDVGHPGPGEVRVRQMAMGLNFLDIYYRTGLYPAPLPFIPGNEGAGEIVEVGEGVSDFTPGDRVAYAGPLGSYAEERLIPAHFVVKLPGAIDFETGAAMMLKGMTAEVLLNRTFKVGPGHTILFHAAAGGVGLIACQWAKSAGAHVIGTVGSEEKAELARKNGCDDVILYRQENFVERVKQITGGRGCDVVYDSVGRDNYPGSLDCLKPFGLFVSFGNSSGVIEGFNLGVLGQKGSLYATRPTLFTHLADRRSLTEIASNLFHQVESGAIKVAVSARYPLRQAAEAQRSLEARVTTGATVLLPD